jgi:hypothetical protein
MFILHFIDLLEKDLGSQLKKLSTAQAAIERLGAQGVFYRVQAQFHIRHRRHILLGYERMRLEASSPNHIVDVAGGTDPFLDGKVGRLSRWAALYIA